MRQAEKMLTFRNKNPGESVTITANNVFSSRICQKTAGVRSKVKCTISLKLSQGAFIFTAHIEGFGCTAARFSRQSFRKPEMGAVHSIHRIRFLLFPAA